MSVVTLLGERTNKICTLLKELLANLGQPRRNEAFAAAATGVDHVYRRGGALEGKR